MMSRLDATQPVTQELRGVVADGDTAYAQRVLFPGSVAQVAGTE